MANTGSIIIVGGGIGGLAAALALTRQNVRVLLLEQAAQLGEIGAGIQLGPNAFSALDGLGVGEAARQRAVFTDHIIMMDAVDAREVVRIDTGSAFRQRFGGPYGVIHRADIHLSILEAVQNNPLVEFKTATHVDTVHVDANGVEVTDTQGHVYRADALIGCDGVKSVVREQTIGRHHRVTGHVVYRAVVDVEDMPADLQVNAPMLWAGPRCHLVHYPLRGGRQYNLVVTFHSREEEVWGVTDGSKEEVLSYFEGIHPRPHQMLHRPTSWRRWATADADPVDAWGQGRCTLLGDAAHPMAQYMAQGACMALEDAVTLGEAVARVTTQPGTTGEQSEFAAADFAAAFRLYESVRVPRTARVVWSTREMGRIYHAKGVERTVRNQLWQGKTRQQFYERLQWLYGWNRENCLQDAA